MNGNGNGQTQNNNETSTPVHAQQQQQQVEQPQTDMKYNNMNYINFEQTFASQQARGYNNNNFNAFPLMTQTSNFSPPQTPEEENSENKSGFMSIASLLQAANGLASNMQGIPNGSPSPFSLGEKMNINGIDGLPGENVSSMVGGFSLPPLINPDKIYESSVRILYMSVSWARSIPTFLELPFADQALLLEESWSELFILCMIQCSMPMDLGVLLSAAGAHTEKAPSQKIASSMQDLRMLQHIVQRFQNVAIDSTEFACLKATVLFKPGNFNCYSYLGLPYLCE